MDKGLRVGQAHAKISTVARTYCGEMSELAEGARLEIV